MHESRDVHPVLREPEGEIPSDYSLAVVSVSGDTHETESTCLARCWIRFGQNQDGAAVNLPTTGRLDH